MSNYKELKVWKKAHGLALEVYKLTNNFPENEKYGIITQIRRAATSIPTNIAEGCGQIDNGNLIRFFGIARGSSFELEYLILLAKDINYLKEEEYCKINRKITLIISMITNLIKSIDKEKFNYT